MTDLEAAWDELHAAVPKGWVAGRPYHHEERRTWEQYAFIPSGAPRGGRPKKEWIAVGPTEVACVREMARCLGEIRDGRWPR